MTIESKIAKNGATLYYVDGKRVSYRDAMMYQRQNRHFQEWRARIAREGEIAAINDYIVTTAAQDTATDAEINLAISFLHQSIPRCTHSRQSSPPHFSVSTMGK